MEHYPTWAALCYEAWAYAHAHPLNAASYVVIAGTILRLFSL